MLKRQITIISTSLLMVLFTYQLPYIANQEIVIDEVMTPDKNTDLRSAEFDRLLEKESLTEEEFQLLKNHADSNTKRILDSRNSINIYDYSIYSKIRHGSIVWVAFMWTIFFIIVPIGRFEFLETIIFPVLLSIAGLILKLELAIIILLAIVIYFAKLLISKDKRELNEKG